ncbi:MAG: hypothetical protein KC561_11570 [Myxococcales bacterium]|nr:hypothetical protein [Myxococcales bacterium]
MPGRISRNVTLFLVPCAFAVATLGLGCRNRSEVFVSDQPRALVNDQFTLTEGGVHRSFWPLSDEAVVDVDLTADTELEVFLLRDDVTASEEHEEFSGDLVLCTWTSDRIQESCVVDSRELTLIVRHPESGSGTHRYSLTMTAIQQ